MPAIGDLTDRSVIVGDDRGTPIGTRFLFCSVPGDR